MSRLDITDDDAPKFKPELVLCVFSYCPKQLKGKINLMIAHAAKQELTSAFAMMVVIDMCAWSNICVC